MKCSRRDFLKDAVLAGGLAAAGLALPRRLWAGTPEGAWLVVGKPEDFPPGIPTTVRAARRLADGAPARNPGIIVVRDGDQVRALGDRCPHKGCPVKWDAGKNQYRCPCHAALFDADGKVLKGPARDPLPALEARVENGEIQVRLPG